MKKLDEQTIHEFGIPSLVLMENAGKGCAEYLINLDLPELEQGIVVLCGHGNNGGDGYVIARWLTYYGYDVQIVEVGKGPLSPETNANRELCQKLEIEIFNSYELEKAQDAIVKAGVIIDAIYGIGFKGELLARIAQVIAIANKSGALRVAVDIASGVNADTGYATDAFMADITLTMEAYKFGHFIGDGRKYSGTTEVIPIGIPDHLWEKTDIAILIDETIAHLPQRNRFSHKGDYGRIAVFAGSSGYTGAAFLASASAVKAGAGLVTLFAHPDNTAIYNDKPYEVMVKVTPLTSEGHIDAKKLKNELDKFDVILLGPGCGLSEYTYELIDFIARHWDKPAVIDADGLNALSEKSEYLNQLADKPFVLTPHWGEFCRLAHVEMDDLHKDCLTELRSFTGKYKVKVLLKSHTSVYYDNELMCLNITGNDGLAKGGSGDLLSGMIAAFLGQKMPCWSAASMAAYHLGLTAEYLTAKQETLSITPSDILSNLFSYDTQSEDMDEA